VFFGRARFLAASMFNYDTWSDSEGDWTDVDCISTDEDHAKELDRLVTCPGCLCMANLKLVAADLRESEFGSAYDCAGIVQAVRELNLAYHCHIHHVDHSDELTTDLNQQADPQPSSLPSTSVNLPLAEDPPIEIKKRGRPRKRGSNQPRDSNGRFAVPSKLGEIFPFKYNYWSRYKPVPKQKPKHLIVKMKFRKPKKVPESTALQPQLPLKLRLKNRPGAFSYHTQ